jgi:glycosyltransferase involved in cell wall biosynthesis
MSTGQTEQHLGSFGLITVIMPCYNAAPFVAEAVSCVLGQSYGNVELIVVDDGSTDGSREILEGLVQAHKQRMRLFSQDRQGPFPARNLGIKHAKGEFIAFLDADDYWTPDCLEKLHAALTSQVADLAYCGWQNVGQGGPGSEPFVPLEYEKADAARAFLQSCPWPIHAALTRRSVIDAVGGFSLRRFSAMDYDLWLRILGHTRALVRVPEVLAFYRWHGQGQISSRKWQQVMDAMEARRNFVQQHADLVAHLSRLELKELTQSQLRKEGYRAYWRRDLHNAQKLFRATLMSGAWKPSDLRYLLPAMLPGALFRKLVLFSDRNRG